MSPGLEPSPGDLARARGVEVPGAAGHEFAAGVTAAAGGVRVLTTVTRGGPPGRGDRTRLVGVDAAGSPQWTREIPDVAGRAVADAPDGGWVLAGERRTGPLQTEAVAVLLDADARVLAGRTHRAAGSDEAAAFTAVAALDDGCYAAGGTAGTAGWVTRLAADLALTAELTLPDVDAVRALAPAAGGVAVAAATLPTTGAGKAHLLLLGTDGDPRWHTVLPVAGHGELAALCRHRDGLAAAGHLAAERGTDLWLVRLDAGGEISWERRLGTPGRQRRGTAIAAWPDGRLAVAGHHLRDLDHRGLSVTAFGPDGEVDWDADLDAGGEDSAAGLAVTADGALVVAANSRSAAAPATRVRLVRLTADGHPSWDVTLPQPAA